MSDALREADRALRHQGRYAGPVTRLLAYLVDAALISFLFGATAALLRAAIEVATPWTLDLTGHELLTAALYLAWGGIYFANGWVLRAKSPGMAVFGLRIVRADGAPLDRKHALLRVVAFPLAFLTFGVGFAGIVVGRHRQAIYDRIADTAVVYGWDAETAKIRAMARERQESQRPEAADADAPA